MMPVHVQMSEDNTHLLYNFEEPLTMSELMKAYSQEKEFRNSVPHTVHSIVDMSEIKRIPPNWLVAKAGPGFTHPRSGRILFVGISRGLKIFIRTILKIVSYDKMQFFDTREEADLHMAKLIQETTLSDDTESAMS